MEKRVLLAAALSALIMVMYAQTLARHQKANWPVAAKSTTTIPEISERVSLIQPLRDEHVTYIKSDHLELELGKESGTIRRAVLRKFKDLKTGHPLQFSGNSPVLAIMGSEGPMHWTFVSSSERRAEWDADYKTNKYHIIMELKQYIPLLYIWIYESGTATNNVNSPLTLVSSWYKGDELDDRYNPLETVLVTVKTRAWDSTYLKYSGAIKSVKSVPRGTRIVTLSDRYFCQILKLESTGANVTLLPSENGSIQTATQIWPKTANKYKEQLSMELYLGSRDHFALGQSGVTEAFQIGAIGRIGIMLLATLSWVAGITRNYGVAIIAFSILMTCALAPFTLIGLKSMRKMQGLKPQIDQVMAKHKGDQQKANRELMALYKENKVSPLSGCLPMLLQLPILMALFGAISHFTELRGQPFLWIHDLSLPDRIAELPVAVPMLGRDLNLLPILMIGAMLVQMKLSQQKMPANDSNPMTKMLSGPFMSILFGFMFYQFPSGLVLYWLTNSLMTIVWYRVAGT